MKKEFNTVNPDIRYRRGDALRRRNDIEEELRTIWNHAESILIAYGEERGSMSGATSTITTPDDLTAINEHDRETSIRLEGSSACYQQPLFTIVGHIGGEPYFSLALLPCSASWNIEGNTIPVTTKQDVKVIGDFLSVVEHACATRTASPAEAV